MKPTPPSKKKTNPDPSSTQTYLKYSGLAFQLLATVGLAAWAGIKLDDYLGFRFPWFTVFLVLLAVTGSMIWLVRQLPKE